MGQAKIKRDKKKALEAAAKPEAPVVTPPQPAVEATTPAKKIFIDVSRVPLVKQKRVEFRALLAAMERKFEDPKQVEAICIHESMHMHYLIKSGADDFLFTGPTISYSETKGFDHTGASIQAKSFDQASMASLTAIEKAFVAGKVAVGGGIAVEKLCPDITDTGDAGDQERFDKTHATLAKSGFTMSKKDFRKESERLVRAELDTIPTLKEAIREIANDFMRDQLFKWV
jgi:hypothetical protein